MDLEIKRLSVDLLDDWLSFFDNAAFTDNDEWAGCYCMFYHWDDALNREKEWGCSRADAPYNRSCAIELIKKGKMQGYLAYDKGEVVGWCNANDREAFNNINLDFSSGDSEKDRKIKSVVCFCISPEARGKGIATRLLERVCADAASEGYEFAEAYPFHDDDSIAFHGPQPMFEKFGFESCGHIANCTVFRKAL